MEKKDIFTVEMEADHRSIFSDVDPPRLPSPVTSPVRLSDFLGEALRFVLSASLLPDGPHLALSRDYCSRLLEDEPTAAAHPILHDENFYQGVPAYPLYKRLAGALERCIDSGRFEGPANSMVSVPVDEDFLKSKESEWNRLISDKGSELLKMLRAVDFELHVQEPFFSQLKAGTKTVEGRCAVGDYNRISPGSLILFNKVLLLEVQHVNHYSTFSEMLQKETLTKVLPGVETIEEGVQIYRKFYTVEKEISHGVLAIFVSKLASQPYDTLADLLSMQGPTSVPVNGNKIRCNCLTPCMPDMTCIWCKCTIKLIALFVYWRRRRGCINRCLPDIHTTIVYQLIHASNDTDVEPYI